MPTPSTGTKRKRIRKNLVDQLVAMGRDAPVFMDKVDEYMTLWDAMQTGGLTFRETLACSKQLQVLLKFLGVTPAETQAPDPEDPDEADL